MALTTTASAAFQPKCCNIKALSQPQAPATISTGGAAYDVKVPPIDTLTNSTPSARYFSGDGMRGVNTSGASMMAAIVMAAGSVMSEPINGTMAKPSQASAVGVGSGTALAMAASRFCTVTTMGRDAAITITTNTNKGSV